MKQAQSMIEVRNSPVHGAGVFALRRIRKGTIIVEYLGDRVSHEEVDERYADKLETDSHTFLFTVDSKIVIDAGRNGNEARFINHACDPNCESTIKNKRVFIEAIRTIQPGEELSYDYAIGRDSDDAPNVDEIFACRCGAANCRGSMLEPRKKPRVRAKGRAAARKKSAAGSRGRGASRTKRSQRGKAGARSAATSGKARPGRRAGAAAAGARARTSKPSARRGR
ncbi:MAG TPA: SET domain-containing protein-lysine N-methyltransferase [Steroidobacteraceae bacterium]